jgi:hypothetical protein
MFMGCMTALPQLQRLIMLEVVMHDELQKKRRKRRLAV